MGAEVMEEEVVEVMMVGTTMATQVLILEEINTEKVVHIEMYFRIRQEKMRICREKFLFHIPWMYHFHQTSKVINCPLYEILFFLSHLDEG